MGLTAFELCKADWAAMPLLPMHLVEQRFKVPATVDGEGEVGRQWDAAWSRVHLPSNARVAVGVGSRGIDGLPGVVRAVVSRLRHAGCRPFVVPAMGSHGGATSEGQREVLAERGVTEASVGAPVRATLDVVDLGKVDGLPLVMDGLAAEADGIVLVNRVKPHTDFSGHFESGLMKMLVVGLGNDAGATSYHRHALERGLDVVIATVGPALLERTNVVLGVGLIENQRHRLSAGPPAAGRKVGRGRAGAPGVRPRAAAAAAARRHRRPAGRRDGQGRERQRHRPQRDGALRSAGRFPVSHPASPGSSCSP